MTTQKLKEYINEVLGNSIRCLLPSYWWKRIIGLVVDKIDEVDSKFDDIKITSDTSMSDSSTNSVQNKVVKAYVDNAVANVEIDVDSSMSSTSTNPVQNKVVKTYVDNKVTPDSSMSSYSSNPVQNKVIKAYVDNKVTPDSSMSDSSTNSVQNKVVKAYIDNAVANVEIDVDTTMSDSSENAIQNKVVKTYVDSVMTEINESIIANEEVIAAALNDLNDRVSSCVQMLEIKYNWDGTELTDEDKAVNAATVAAVAAGGEYMLYNDLYGMITIASTFAISTEDSPELQVAFESDLLPMAMLNKIMLLIDETGTVVYTLPIQEEGALVDLSNATDYTSLRNTLGNTDGYLYGKYISAGFDGYSNGYIVGGLSNEVGVSFQYIMPSGDIKRVSSSASSGTIEISYLKGGTLTINPAEGSSALDNNKLINSGTKDIRIAKDDKYYSPIIQDGLNFTIYTGSAYETWQLNSDGTTTQIS